MLETISKTLMLVLAAWLPFEFLHFPILSNLQWIFIVAVAFNIPLLVRNWRKLIHDRFVQAATLFVVTQGFVLIFAGEYVANSLKAVIRVSAGLVLFCIVWCRQDYTRIVKYWSIGTLAAVLYGFADYMGFGVPQLFRQGQFYFSDQLRLSGSFEYPTTAAAYYAMSLPIVFASPTSRFVRIAGCLAVWAALLLTYSRGAAIAVAIALLFGIRAIQRTTAVKVALAGLVLFALLAFFHPELVTRYADLRSGKAVSAQYSVDFNMLRQRPLTSDQLKVTLRNTGIKTWRAEGDSQVVLSYHWYDTVKKNILRETVVETLLPRDIRPDQTVTITASFRTPGQPGMYLLDWDLKEREKGWFSTAYELAPAVVETYIEDGTTAWKGNGDVSRWYARPNHVVMLDATVSRPELWNAAFALFRRSPLVGSGPDSFRFLYGRELGAGRWDTNIRSNSLYFELLVGSGLIGLGAFIGMLFAVRWKASAASIAAAVFLLHGVVDVLLMTTPIYFGFWMLLGLAHENRV